MLPDKWKTEEHNSDIDTNKRQTSEIAHEKAWTMLTKAKWISSNSSTKQHQEDQLNLCDNR